MKQYPCRMPGYDSHNAFTIMQAGTIEGAAERYAARCDEDSGGDLFQDEGDSWDVEVVCPERGTINVTVYCEHQKVYTAYCVEQKRKAA